MPKTNRWMTWVLEESAQANVTMPWARGTRPDWQQNLAVDTPDLAAILEHGMEMAGHGSHFPRQAAS